MTLTEDQDAFRSLWWTSLYYSTPLWSEPYLLGVNDCRSDVAICQGTDQTDDDLLLVADTLFRQCGLEAMGGI